MGCPPPENRLKEPKGHSVHAVRPKPLLNVPGAQMSQKGWPVRGCACVGVQLWQRAMPGLPFDMPAGHGTHAAAYERPPDCGATVPAGHAMQSSGPSLPWSGLYVPAGHSTGSGMAPVIATWRRSRVMGSSDQPSAQKAPGGQGRQAVAPCTGLYDPGAHEAHATAAVLARGVAPLFPIGHWRQMPSPVPYVPRVQGAHSSIPVARPHPGVQLPYRSGPGAIGGGGAEYRLSTLPLPVPLLVPEGT